MDVAILRVIADGMLFRPAAVCTLSLGLVIFLWLSMRAPAVSVTVVWLLTSGALTSHPPDAEKNGTYMLLSLLCLRCAGRTSLARVGALQADTVCASCQELVGTSVATIGFPLASPSAGIGPVAAFGGITAALPCLPGNMNLPHFAGSAVRPTAAANEGQQQHGGIIPTATPERSIRGDAAAQGLAPGLLLTDAAVYPGCSGGALICMHPAPQVM
jgi:hypothetical protein